MKYIIGLLSMLLPILTLAQSTPVKALSIGDTVPDITITNVYNYPSPTLRLSDLKGKLVILDFWATWCGACLTSFPEMQELNDKFNGQLQVLCVNSFDGDDSAKVNKTFTRIASQTGNTVKLPYILHDSLLNQYFPHSFIPHCVWLDSSRRVVAITEKDDVTEKNIQIFLTGGAISVEMKRDNLQFNSKIPLLVDNNGGTPDAFLYRTIITRYKPNFGSQGGIIRDSAGKITRAYFINTHIYNLLISAYPEIRKLDQCRILFKTQSAERFRYSSDRVIKRAHSYCYEIIGPGITEEGLRKYMRADLKRYLHVSVSIEQKVMNCYVLTANKNAKNLYSKGDNGEWDVQKNTLHKRILNQPVKMLAKILTDILNVPVINESGVSQHIDMDFPYNIYNYDFKKMSEFLQKKGFEIAASKRKILVAVISGDNE